MGNLIIVKFTPEQYDNLLIFLQRTDLKGSEVAAFVQVVNALKNAEKTELK